MERGCKVPLTVRNIREILNLNMMAYFICHLNTAANLPIEVRPTATIEALGHSSQFNLVTAFPYSIAIKSIF